MRLHEAIEQAGPGGKIRREGWGEGSPWCIVDDYIELEGGQSGANVDSIRNLTATDWEVVQEERIEVGDIVKWGDSMAEAIVVVVAGNNICYQLKNDDLLMLSRLKGATLIHKGSKRHVFEGVEFCQTTPPKGLPHVAMIDKGGACYKNDSMKEVRDNGKTYRMTLEEME